MGKKGILTLVLVVFSILLINFYLIGADKTEFGSGVSEDVPYGESDKPNTFNDNSNTLPKRCYLEPDAGSCKANFERYYYDSSSNSCKSFVWGGCEGSVPFDDLGECESVCGNSIIVKKTLDEGYSVEIPYSESDKPNQNANDNSGEKEKKELGSGFSDDVPYTEEEKIIIFKKKNGGEIEVKTKEKVEVSSGQLYVNEKKVKIMPDVASQKAIDQLKLKQDVEIELKDVGKPTYVIDGEKDVELFCFIDKKMNVEIEVDANEGSVEKVSKPWWGAVTCEKKEKEVNKNKDNNGIENRENYFISNSIIFDRTFEENNSDNFGYIIEFNEPSLAEKKVQIEKSLPKTLDKASKDVQIKNALDSQKQKIETEQTNALNDINSKLGKNINVENKFTKIFNGIVLNISSSEAEKIKSSPYVKNVYPNYEVHTTLMDSIPLINADEVWQIDIDGNNCIESGKECLTGKNVTIAIIDTGVDYTHPDLGGCTTIGPDCKVVGGYDFANNDDDPMDDIGHGTHVAATAAGNGVLKGVAPDAKIYAYKVFPITYGDIILNAIEASIDPNGDEDFSDHVDIISMSLGGSGNPDDPLSKSVDNAIDNGIVVVISAGNSGPQENTIGSPGTSRKAITVGATYKKDYEGQYWEDTNPRINQITSFSSRGPVIWEDDNQEINYLMKPDIVAPGAIICAAQSSQDIIWQEYIDHGRDIHCLDDKHIDLSGTSMATPIVSGSVALIKQAHSDWTPEEIKSSLKGTSIDLGLPFETQGSGRIDVFKTIKLDHSLPIIKSIQTKLNHTNLQLSFYLSGADMNKYEISYKNIGDSQWSLLYLDNLTIEGIYTHNFNMVNLSEGLYQIKLSAFNNLGFKTDEIIYQKIQRIVIKEPYNNNVIKPGNILEIKGSIMLDEDNEYYVVKINNDLNTDIIYPNFNGSYSINNGILAYLNSSKINDNGLYEIIIQLYKKDLSHDILISEKSVRIFFDKKLSSGWPYYVDASNNYEKKYYNSYLNLNVLDIDKDGKEEIIFLKRIGRPVLNVPAQLFILDNSGNNYPNFPISLPFIISLDESYSPSFADLNNDGLIDIVIGGSIGGSGEASTTAIYAYNINGSLLAGFPINIEEYVQLNNDIPLVLSDLNNDGKTEIIANSIKRTVDNHVDRLYVFDNSGKVLDGFPLEFESSDVQPLDLPLQPIVGNFDSDNNLEIAYIVEQRELGIYKQNLYIIEDDGSIKSGFPKELCGRNEQSIKGNCFVKISPVAGDIDNDQKDEIIVYIEYSGLYIIDDNGEIITRLPNQDIGDNSIFVQPALSDINLDGDLDIVFGSVRLSESGTSELNMYVVNKNGTIFNGWPISFPLQSNFLPEHGSPIIGDVNGDNRLDILFASFDQIRAYDYNGSNIKDFPLIAEKWTYSVPSITDIDGDGKIEIIASSKFNYDYITSKEKYRGSIYVWDLDYPYNKSNLPWSMFQHDPQHTGCYDCDKVVEGNVFHPPKRCYLEPDAGSCKANFERYYYDPSSNSCKSFVWGGCEGSVPFDDLYDCQVICEGQIDYRK